MTQVTEWYPCTIKPVRIGWYEWCSEGNERNTDICSWFDGENWKWSPTTTIPFYEQDYGFWRGLKK